MGWKRPRARPRMRPAAPAIAAQQGGYLGQRPLTALASLAEVWSSQPISGGDGPASGKRARVPRGPRSERQSLGSSKGSFVYWTLSFFLLNIQLLPSLGWKLHECRAVSAFLNVDLQGLMHNRPSFGEWIDEECPSPTQIKLLNLYVWIGEEALSLVYVLATASVISLPQCRYQHLWEPFSIQNLGPHS